MRMRDRDDQPAEYVGRPKLNDDALGMARAMSVVKLRAAGYTFAAIARFHGISRQYAHQLYHGVPDHVRRRTLALFADPPDAEVGRPPAR